MKEMIRVITLLCMVIFSYSCTKEEELPQIYQFIIYEKDLPGWEQSFAERGFAIVEGETFFDIINGGAQVYIEHNYKKALRQEIIDTTGKTLILIAAEFENEAEAEKMFIDTKEEGVEYVKLASYELTQARGYLFADGITITAIYKNIYFVVQLAGYTDSSASIAQGVKILELLFRKGEA
ncbi:MAG: hypothetical protein N2053_00240 [Chitinispirillaceae bacterium]|nr:hypothetical protein [Chitinispirillaceae bacterium]